MTGATGFIGAHFMPLMARHGHGLAGLVRPTSKRAHLLDQVGHWCEGDVTNQASVDAAVRQLRERASQAGRPAWIVHGAAVISYRTGSGRHQEAVNVEGTRHVMEAAQRFGVDRVLLVSSVVTVGVAEPGGPALDENADFKDVQRICGKPYVSEYMRTKRAAEQLALERASRADFELVIVNPGAVFGSAPVPSNTAQIFRKAESSLIGRIASPGALSVVGVWDVAEGMRLALERGRSGRRYLLTDEALPMGDLLERVLFELRSSRQPIRLSPLLWHALVGGVRLADRIKRFEVVTPTALELLGLDFRFDASRARSELGWTPEPFDAVLQRTGTWLREIGWIEGRP